MMHPHSFTCRDRTAATRRGGPMASAHKIQTLYIANHSHTDIGFTDYQDLCVRQHAEFIDQALDLIEATQDYPEEARYRWVCEVTGMTEAWFRQANSTQIERFKTWHAAGFIDVAGMQYNHTPMQ